MTGDDRGRAHAVLVVVALALVSGLLAIGLALEPDARGYGTHERLGLPPCPLLAWTGVPCPSCGVTTSVALVTRGRVDEALRVQPTGVLLVVLAVGLAGLVLATHLAGGDAARRLVRLRPWRVWPVLMAVVLVGWGLVLRRMLVG